MRFQTWGSKVNSSKKLASWTSNSSFIHAQEVVQSCKSQHKLSRHGAWPLPLVYLCSNYAITLQQTGSLWTAHHAVALCVPPSDSSELTTQSAFRQRGIRGQRSFFFAGGVLKGLIGGLGVGVGVAGWRRRPRSWPTCHQSLFDCWPLRQAIHAGFWGLEESEQCRFYLQSWNRNKVELRLSEAARCD